MYGVLFLVGDNCKLSPEGVHMNYAFATFAYEGKTYTPKTKIKYNDTVYVSLCMHNDVRVLVPRSLSSKFSYSIVPDTAHVQESESRAPKASTAKKERSVRIEVPAKSEAVKATAQAEKGKKKSVAQKVEAQRPATPRWLAEVDIATVFPKVTAGQPFEFGVVGNHLTMTVHGKDGADGKIGPYYFEAFSPKGKGIKVVKFNLRKPREPLLTRDLTGLDPTPSERFVSVLKDKTCIPDDNLFYELRDATQNVLTSLDTLRTTWMQTSSTNLTFTGVIEKALVPPEEPREKVSFPIDADEEWKEIDAMPITPSRVDAPQDVSEDELCARV